MRKTILAAVLLTAALPAVALTLGEAQRMAREHYPLVGDYGLIALTAQYDVENASKAWLPQVAVGAQASWQTAVAAYPDVLKEMLAQRGLDVKGIDRFQYRATVDVRQTLWDGGRTKARQDIARAEAEESRCLDDVEMYSLRGRVDNLFFSILLLEQQERAIGAAIDLLQANLDKVEALLHGGAAMQSDADAVEAELLVTRQQHVSVRSAIGAYRAVLGLYLGSDGNEPLEMPDDFIVPAGAGGDARPEQRLFDARLALLDARQGALDASLRPHIGAFVQGAYGYPGLNFMEAMMDRTPRLSAVVGLTATWDITSFYTRKNRLGALDVARRRIETARRTFEFNNGLQAAAQRREIERLRMISVTDAEIVALRARVRNASEARLREGIIEPTDLLLRITEEKNAMIAANSHRIEYLKALYSLLDTLNR